MPLCSGADTLSERRRETRGHENAKHRVLKARFRRVEVVSAILRNPSRDLGLGIAVMTIVRSFSKNHLARILVSF